MDCTQYEFLPAVKWFLSQFSLIFIFNYRDFFTVLVFICAFFLLWLSYSDIYLAAILAQSTVPRFILFSLPVLRFSKLFSFTPATGVETVFSEAQEMFSACKSMFILRECHVTSFISLWYSFSKGNVCYTFPLISSARRQLDNYKRNESSKYQFILSFAGSFQSLIGGVHPQLRLTFAYLSHNYGKE